MIASRQPRTFTFEQYLELEASSEGPNEFIDGFIWAMTGGTPRHARLVGRVFALLDRALRGRSCATYSSELHLYLEKANRGTYADASVFCAPLQYWGKRTDVVTNPTLVVEVLSPSTEADDRTAKLDAYKSAGSVMEIVLVAQDTPRIEVHARQGDGAWLVRTFMGPDATAQLDSIGVALPLGELYDGV